MRSRGQHRLWAPSARQTRSRKASAGERQRRGRAPRCARGGRRASRPPRARSRAPAARGPSAPARAARSRGSRRPPSSASARGALGALEQRRATARAALAAASAAAHEARSTSARSVAPSSRGEEARPRGVAERQAARRRRRALGLDALGLERGGDRARPAAGRSAPAGSARPRCRAPGRVRRSAGSGARSDAGSSSVFSSRLATSSFIVSTRSSTNTRRDASNGVRVAAAHHRLLHVLHAHDVRAASAGPRSGRDACRAARAWRTASGSRRPSASSSAANARAAVRLPVPGRAVEQVGVRGRRPRAPRPAPSAPAGGPRCRRGRRRSCSRPAARGLAPRPARRRGPSSGRASGVDAPPAPGSAAASRS